MGCELLSSDCEGKEFLLLVHDPNRQAHEMEHQLSIALVDSDGWKQMEFGIAVYDTVCPKCCMTETQAFSVYIHTVVGVGAADNAMNVVSCFFPLFFKCIQCCCSNLIYIPGISPYLASQISTEQQLSNRG